MVDETQVQKLIKDAKRGNSQAFGQIYDLYSPKLFNFILAKTQNRTVAEDLLQTVFLKAWNNLSKYKPSPSAKFSTWLFQIANYTLIDYWRTRKDTVEIDKLENLALFAVEAKQYENFSFLWSAINQLPEDYKTVIHLRYIQDLSIKEAALVMNRTQISIRVMQHRALKTLRNILRQQGHENF